MNTPELYEEFTLKDRYVKCSEFIFGETNKNFAGGDLFRNLKLYEIKVFGNGETQFDLMEIKKVFLKFLPTQELIKNDTSWNGYVTHKEFLAILNLVLTARQVSSELFKILTRQDFIQYCIENQRKCLIISDWGFPFGGAEAFFEETALTMFELGFIVDWATFQRPGKGSFSTTRVLPKGFYTEHQYSEYPDKFTLTRIVKDLGPQIVFSHGPMNNLLAQISEEMGVILIEGFHFWSGIISLENSSNRNIIDNLQKHALSHRVSSIRKEGSSKYFVSEFMKEVYLAMGGDEEFEIIHPIVGDSISKSCKSKSQGFVSQLDVSIGKGGHIFCDLVQQLGDRIPFLAVIRDTTEDEIIERLLSLSVEFETLVLIGYTELTSILEESTLVIVPSLVDETYSRITAQAVSFGIPVLTSAYGNLARILDGVGAIAQMESIEWKQRLSRIYDDIGETHKLWERQSKALGGKSERNILSLILGAIKTLKIERIGVFCVNAPQGLGTLAKVLSNELESVNLNTYLFAFCPYNKNLIRDDYWNDLIYFDSDRILISPYTREHVPISEILEFVDMNQLDVFIFPEMCWAENWSRVFELSQLRPNLHIVTMPMLETVIKNEVQFMNHFALTLFPTVQSQSVLKELGVRNGYFIGFTSPLEKMSEQNDSNIKISSEEGKIKYLHIAGHSPNVRKNTRTIIGEFLKALEIRRDITLTITLQEVPQEIADLALPIEIQMIERALSDSEIAELYKSHDVSIQIPTHEGIGIGFYESTSLGVPVITLNRKPHSEIIKSEFSGWLLPATPFDLPDNSQGVVNAGNLALGSLSNLLVKLSFQDVMKIKLRTQKYYLENYSNEIFKTQLLSSLGSKIMINPKQSSVHMKKAEIRYHRFFNKFLGFCKRYLKDVIPLSINQKYKIKQLLLLIDQKISSGLK